jgi:hypothetical protein
MKGEAMAVENLTDEEIVARLNVLDGMLARANYKDLPALNITYQRLIDEQVRRDLQRVDDTPTGSGSSDGKVHR